MNITAGKFKGRKIIAPNEKITRPTLSKTREGVFNTLFSMIDFEEKSFLDMYAGSGIMGLEALSRGFCEVVCIEKSLQISKILKKNYASLGLKPNCYVGDSIKVVPKIEKTFDVIYIDPPYASDLYEKSLQIIKTCNLLKDKGIIILEHSKPLDFCEFELIKKKIYSQKMVTYLVK